MRQILLYSYDIVHVMDTTMYEYTLVYPDNLHTWKSNKSISLYHQHGNNYCTGADKFSKPHFKKGWNRTIL